MKVYSIDVDVNHYQHFLPCNDEDWSKLELDCTPKADIWIPPAMVILNPKFKAGDFYNFGSGYLITNQKATYALQHFLERAGELLPFTFEGEEFTVLNVLECTNSLDHEKTEWYYGEKDGVKIRISPKEYVFHRDRFSGSPIFKIPETCRGEILILEKEDDPDCDDEFRNVVEQEGLTGLIFKELWNDHI